MDTPTYQQAMHAWCIAQGGSYSPEAYTAYAEQVLAALEQQDDADE